MSERRTDYIVSATKWMDSLGSTSDGIEWCLRATPSRVYIEARVQEADGMEKVNRCVRSVLQIEHVGFSAEDFAAQDVQALFKDLCAPEREVEGE